MSFAAAVGFVRTCALDLLDMSPSHALYMPGYYGLILTRWIFRVVTSIYLVDLLTSCSCIFDHGKKELYKNTYKQAKFGSIPLTFNSIFDHLWLLRDLFCTRSQETVGHGLVFSNDQIL